MKKLYFVLLLVVAGFAANAQSLTPTVIASTGAFSQNGNYSLSYTVGEMTMVQTFTSQNQQTILTQGFQQPNDKVTGLIDITQGDFGSFVLYPNPAVDQFWFGFQLPEEGRVNIALYDALGQKLSDIYYANYDNGKIVQNANVSNLAAGVYLVTLTLTSTKDGSVHQQTKKLQVIR